MNENQTKIKADTQATWRKAKALAGELILAVGKQYKVKSPCLFWLNDSNITQGESRAFLFTSGHIYFP